MSGIRIRCIGSLGQDQMRRDPRSLVKAISPFKPSDANPKQFYNCVREMCIMHNCGIHMGLKRAQIVWPDLSQRQRDSYNSELLAELPIPMPVRNHQQAALQKKLSGPKTVGRSSMEDKQQTNKKPKLSEKRPKVDNQKKLDSKVTPNQPKLSSQETIPQGVHLVRSISQLLSKVSTNRRRETNNYKRKMVEILFSYPKESDEEGTHLSSDKNIAKMLKLPKKVKRELETNDKNNKKFKSTNIRNNGRRQRIR